MELVDTNSINCGQIYLPAQETFANETFMTVTPVEGHLVNRSQEAAKHPPLYRIPSRCTRMCAHTHIVEDIVLHTHPSNNFLASKASITQVGKPRDSLIQAIESDFCSLSP